MECDTVTAARARRPILLVDDEEQILRAHSSALQLAGFEQIIACKDAREVEGLLTQSSYSAILLDLAMPHVNGIQLLPIIRRHQPETPVIVISAFGDVEAVAGAVDTQVHDFLLKPVDRTQLVRAVERALAPGDRADCVRERESLLQEIHHRVNNNLQVLASLISLHEAKTRDIAARDILAAMQTRIALMAMAHQLLYEVPGLSEIGVTSLAHCVARNVEHYVDTPAQHFSIVVECKPHWVPLRDAVPLALILSEVMTNALQHAFHTGEVGTLTVGGAHSPAGGYHISVCDDGHGVPPYPTLRGLGLSLVTACEKQIGATGRFEQNSPQGTRYVLTLRTAEVAV